MGNSINCGENCTITCPEGYEAWCSYECNQDGCLCSGGCTKVDTSGYLLPEETTVLRDFIVEHIDIEKLFPLRPIDPPKLLIINFPKMRLWQFAMILRPLIGQELQMRASKVWDEVPCHMRLDSTSFFPTLEDLGLSLFDEKQINESQS